MTKIEIATYLVESGYAAAVRLGLVTAERWIKDAMNQNTKADLMRMLDKATTPGEQARQDAMYAQMSH